jgi:hypothetical protein
VGTLYQDGFSVVLSTFVKNVPTLVPYKHPEIIHVGGEGEGLKVVKPDKCPTNTLKLSMHPRNTKFKYTVRTRNPS